MGDIVNLNRVRKRTEKQKASRTAEERRARFGRTKMERVEQEERARKHDAALDQHRLGEDET